MVSCGTRKQLKDKNQYDSIRFCLTWWPRYYARCWASHGPYLFTGTSSLTGEWEGHSKLATKHGQQLGIETEHHVSQICREVEMICVREWLKSDCWYIWRDQIMRNLKAFSFQPIQSGNRWWFEMFSENYLRLMWDRLSWRSRTGGKLDNEFLWEQRTWVRLVTVELEKKGWTASRISNTWRLFKTGRRRKESKSPHWFQLWMASVLAEIEDRCFLISEIHFQTFKEDENWNTCI